MAPLVRRWAGWLVAAVLLVGAVAVGATRGGSETTEADRVSAIASSVRCPTCNGQSALESDAVAAGSIRTDIARRVAAGEGDDEIRAYYVSRFGESILLTPPRSGLAGLVWALPVAGLVLALGALVFAFRRWRIAPGLEVDDEDRLLVERARSRTPS